MLNLTRTFLIEALAAYANEGNLGKGGLYLNPTPFHPLSVWADLDQPTFPGYSTRTVQWSAPFVNGLGRVQVNGTSLTWVVGAGAWAGPETVHGAWVSDTDNNLKFTFHFPAPITIIGATQPVFWTPALTCRLDECG